MIPNTQVQRPPAPVERADRDTNGHSLSRIADEEDGVVLAFAGELDIASAEEFGDRVCRLTAGEKGEVVLDLEHCGFIDSSGLRALIMLGRELRARGQTLVLSGLRGGPRRVFEITGLLDGRAFEVRDATPDMNGGATVRG